MAHGSDYKPSICLPEHDQKRVKRSLAKGSALIETTDDVFKEIKLRLREYSESIDALLKQSSEIYQNLTGEAANPSTALGLTIADTYRILLRELSPDRLQQWANERKWLGNVLKTKRSQSVFYRDSVVILLGWLVTEHQVEIPKFWPVEGSYLEEFYTTLGISHEGLF